MKKIIGCEGKCGCGKTTYLISVGALTPEFNDYYVDEITYDKSLGMISFEDQLKFVQFKIDEFKEKIIELKYSESDKPVYMDRQVLSPIAFGAGYYEWYGLSKKEISDYLDKCYELLKQLPDNWTSFVEALILIPENDLDIRKRIVNRGRDYEVRNIESILDVNNRYLKYLINLLEDFGVEYHLKVIVHNK